MERPDLSIPTTTGDELSLEWSTLSEDGVAEEYYGILQAERAPVSYLVQILEELWRLNRYAVTFTILNQALGDNKNPSERLPLLAMKANYLLCMARKAPKLLLSRPRAGKPLAKSRDPNHPECLKDGEFDGPPMTKDEYWTLADQCIQEATRIKPDDKRVKDLQGEFILSLPLSPIRAKPCLPPHSNLAIHHLLKAAHEPSLRHIEQILSTEPTNLMALTAKARILFAKRSFRPALRLYQTILTLNPQFLPDPRIGIGLCLWMLGEKERARKAWERSLEVVSLLSSFSYTGSESLPVLSPLYPKESNINIVDSLTSITTSIISPTYLKRSNHTFRPSQNGRVRKRAGNVTGELEEGQHGLGCCFSFSQSYVNVRKLRCCLPLSLPLSPLHFSHFSENSN